MKFKLRKRTIDNIQYLALIMPALFFFLTFALSPVFRSAWLALTNLQFATDINHQFVGLENFREILFAYSSPLHQDFVNAVTKNFIFWVGNEMCSLIFGLLFALFFYEKTHLKSLFIVIIFLPYVVSELALGFLLRLVLDPKMGAVNQLLRSAGLIQDSVGFFKDGYPASMTLISVTAWKYAGFNMILFLGGLIGVSLEQIEAARVDGAAYLQRLFKIIIPQIWPTTIMVFVFSLTGCWQFFALPYALMGGSAGTIKSLNLVAVVFYDWAFSNIGFAKASSLILMVALPIFIISLTLLRLIRKKTVEY